MHLSTERGMRTMNWVQGFLCIRESYQHFRGLSLLVIGCHIIVLNVHAPAEEAAEEVDDLKGSFYDELEHVFDKCSSHVVILIFSLSIR
jgi:hypothetical protein